MAVSFLPHPILKLHSFYSLFFFAKKFNCFVHTHFQHIINIFFLVVYFQHFFFKSFSAAYFAYQMNICKELHFHYLFAFSFAGIATAAINIKRKMLWQKPAHFTQWLFTEKLAYFIICFYISNRIAA